MTRVSWLGQQPADFDDALRQAGLDDLPRQADVDALINEYQELIQGAQFPQNEQQAVEWAKTVVTNYLREQGIPVTEEEARNIAENYVKNQLEEAGLPSSIPTNASELQEVLQGAAVTAAAQQLGIDPRYIVVTYEALADGKLDRSELESIGGMAGAVAGAALAQTFGIPAPIGAFFGGEFGKLVGGTIGEIFSIGGVAEEFEQQRKEQYEELVRWRNQMQEQCEKIRGLYWQQFDAMIRRLEGEWRKLEQQVGFNFALRWFGAWPFVGPFERRYDQGNFVGYFFRDSPVGVTGAVGAGFNVNNMPLFQCGAPLGCSYPEVPRTGAEVLGRIIVPLPPGGLGQVTVPIIPILVSPTSPTMQRFERVAQAYSARGLEWTPPENRQPCFIPFPPVAATTQGSTRAQYTSTTITAIRSEMRRLNTFVVVTTAIVGDLTRTAAILGAAPTILGRTQAPPPAPRSSAVPLIIGAAIAAGAAWALG